MKNCILCKRILIAAVLCLLVLLLAACGSKSKKTETPTAAPTAVPTEHVTAAPETTVQATTVPTTIPVTTAPATTAPATTGPETTTTAPTSFTVSFDADATQGSVSGCLPDLARSIESGALVERGTTVTLTATANEGFTFAGWFRGDEAVSDVTPFSFTVENDPIALTAHFDMTPSFGTETTPIEGGDGSWELNGD